MPDQQMQIGVVFPQTEIGSDPIAVRDYAQAAEELGFAHIIAYDHVLGADTSYHQPWTGSYTKDSMFHEIFVGVRLHGRADPPTWSWFRRS